MPCPQTADPAAWAEYNAKLLGMTPDELSRELVSNAGADELAHTVAVLTPSGELARQVIQIADALDAFGYEDLPSALHAIRCTVAALRKAVL